MSDDLVKCPACYGVGYEYTEYCDVICELCEGLCLVDYRKAEKFKKDTQK